MRQRIEATHFIEQYSILVKNLGTQEIYIQQCDTGVRELKYLEPVLKSTTSGCMRTVAVWKIQFKK